MDKRKAMELLKQYLDEIPKLRNGHNDEDYELWVSRVANMIKGWLDQEDQNVFASAHYNGLPSPTKYGIKGTGYGNPGLPYYQENITKKETALKSILQKYEILGIEEKSPSEAELHPKAFIAHEGETRSLTMLKEFLEALGIQYFIAESKASGGRSIEKQVDWTQANADFAICLATKGKAINKKTGSHYMAPNIADELGRARQVFGDKTVLLVQKGVEVHTNTREIVYETFTSANMERAFIKIARELVNWGFIKVGVSKE